MTIFLENNGFYVDNKMFYMISFSIMVDLSLLFQGDLLYEMIPSSPASDIFYLNPSNGEIRIRNAALLRSDRTLQYLVSKTQRSIFSHPNLNIKKCRS